MKRTYAVSQLGARMHYAIPRMFYTAGMLEYFFTDICAQKGWPRLLALIPGSLQSPGMRRLSGRVVTGVPPRLVTAFTAFGMEYSRRRSRARTPTESTEAHLWAGRQFCELIIRSGLGDACGVFTYNSAALELLEHARKLGLKTIVEQTIAPTEIELDILGRETAAHPDWEPEASRNDLSKELADRERAEWQNADVILCGSEFVRQGVISCGGDASRCKVVPYGVKSLPSPRNNETHSGPLRVLTVGALGLRKGTPYVLDAARLLGAKASFRLAGPIGISDKALGLLNACTTVLGVVPRSEMAALYDNADVFLLPSLCEGSATATYEALAAGLPVITTPNSGSVVRDGEDGFIVPVANAGAIAEKLELLAEDRALLQRMSDNARHRSKEFTLEAYSRRLFEAIGESADIHEGEPSHA